METPGNPGSTGAPTPENLSTRERFCAPLSEKRCPLDSPISRSSDTPPYIRVPEARPTRSSTFTTRSGTGDLARPAARQRATFRSEQPGSPERRPSAPRPAHEIDRPAAGACPRPGSPTAWADQREAPPVRCGRVSWPARETNSVNPSRGGNREVQPNADCQANRPAVLHLTSVRTTQNPTERPEIGGFAT